MSTPDSTSARAPKHVCRDPNFGRNLHDSCDACGIENGITIPGRAPPTPPSDETPPTYRWLTAEEARARGIIVGSDPTPTPREIRTVAGELPGVGAERQFAWTTHTEEEIAENMAHYGCSREEFEAVERLADVCGDGQGPNDMACAIIWGALTDARAELAALRLRAEAAERRVGTLETMLAEERARLVYDPACVSPEQALRDLDKLRAQIELRATLSSQRTL